MRPIELISRIPLYANLWQAQIRLFGAQIRAVNKVMDMIDSDPSLKTPYERRGEMFPIQQELHVLRQEVGLARFQLRRARGTL